MKRAALIFFAALLVCACKTTIDPIEIDLSKRTPEATPVPSAAPTPTPAPTKVSAIAPAAAAPGPESAPARVAAAKPAPPETARAAAPPTSPGPEDVVEAQIAAYNRRDLDGFLAAYSADAIVYDPPDRIRAEGMEAIRQANAKSFAEAPQARATISRRLTEGRFVVDHENVSGLPGGGSASSIVVYEVRDGKIRRAWILR